MRTYRFDTILGANHNRSNTHVTQTISNNYIPNHGFRNKRKGILNKICLDINFAREMEEDKEISQCFLMINKITNTNLIEICNSLSNLVFNYENQIKNIAEFFVKKILIEKQCQQLYLDAIVYLNTHSSWTVTLKNNTKIGILKLVLINLQEKFEEYDWNSTDKLISENFVILIGKLHSNKIIHDQLFISCINKLLKDQDLMFVLLMIYHSSLHNKKEYYNYFFSLENLSYRVRFKLEDYLSDIQEINSENDLKVETTDFDMIQSVSFLLEEYNNHGNIVDLCTDIENLGQEIKYIIYGICIHCFENNLIIPQYDKIVEYLCGKYNLNFSQWISIANSIENETDLLLDFPTWKTILKQMTFTKNKYRSIKFM